jgi:hypothetical protein
MKTLRTKAAIVGLCFWVTPLLLLALSSCQSHKGTMASPICRVVQKVYDSEWKTCGEITVYSDGSYIWNQTNIWQTPPSTTTHTGKVDSQILRTLKTSVETSSRWEKLKGVPTSVQFIDDTKTKPVPGVEELVSFLHSKHSLAGK